MFKMFLVLLGSVAEITKQNPSIISDVLPIYIFFFADILGSSLQSCRRRHPVSVFLKFIPQACSVICRIFYSVTV
jgi:hypothetical protein